MRKLTFDSKQQSELLGIVKKLYNAEYQSIEVNDTSINLEILKKTFMNTLRNRKIDGWNNVDRNTTVSISDFILLNLPKKLAELQSIGSIGGRSTDMESVHFQAIGNLLLTNNIQGILDYVANFLKEQLAGITLIEPTADQIMHHWAGKVLYNTETIVRDGNFIYKITKEQDI